MEINPILQIEKVSKQFPAVLALSEVSIDIYPGEVHAIIGENGAGKSTLMKIISGVYQPSEGGLILNGDPIEFSNPIHAMSMGIGMVYQELSVFPAATVAENILASRLPVRGSLNFVDEKAMHKHTEEIFAPFGLSIDLDRPLRDLRFSEQQITEICKAISLDARILLLDEPTSALTTAEIETLFKIIDQLRNDGEAIVYVSHRISEIMEIADRVTVLRDGQKIATLPISEATPDSLVRMMVGRTIEAFYPPYTPPIEKTVFEVKGLKTDLLKDISFKVDKGEIFGISGLVGAGRSELLRAIFGLDEIEAGKFLIDEEEVENYLA